MGKIKRLYSELNISVKQDPVRIHLTGTIKIHIYMCMTYTCTLVSSLCVATGTEELFLKIFHPLSYYLCITISTESSALF